jgi:hypothetical protein
MPINKLDIPPETEDTPHTPYQKQILRMREYRAKNKEKLNKYRATYYQNNREEIREYSRDFMKKYYDENPEKRIAHNDYIRTHRKKLTDEEKAEKEAVKQAKKELRQMVRAVAYNKKIMEQTKHLENEIASKEELINTANIKKK